MAAISFDVETSIFKKGNVFAKKNKLCYIGCCPENKTSILGDETYVSKVYNILQQADTVVGFNIKFDLHWLRRCGYSLANKNIWDAQLAHFILTNQKERYPALEGVCKFYGLEGKDPIIERDYWSKGIDTPDIPRELMLAYLNIDLIRTLQVYEKQLEHFKDYPKMYTLFKVQCQDLHVLEEMEWNGLKLNVEQAHEEGAKTRKRLDAITQELSGMCPRVALNWDSGDDLSCFLYGGIVTRELREVAGVYLSGQKIGQPRYRIIREEYELPPLTKPIEGSALKKEGYYATDEKTLKQLKGINNITSLLLERAKLSKLLDYFDGLPSLIDEMDWEEGMLHGQLNQCTAITGRLSATNPNQQNLPPAAQALIVSRYDT